jgi:hypothetical protein
MGGRHRTAADQEALRQKGFAGRHQRRGPSARALVIPVVLLVLTAGTATAVAARTGVFGCLRSQTELTVFAAPDIAPALDKIAQRFHNGDIGNAGRCVDVTVTTREPQQVAEAVASAEAGGSGADLPDVWVPDSSLWLEAVRANLDEARQQAGAQSDQAGQQDGTQTAKLLGSWTSIAHSPLVVALIRPFADQLGGSQTKLGWSDLLKRAAQPGAAAPLRVGVVDPNRSAASLGTLLAVQNVTAKADRTLQIGAMRALSSNVAATERAVHEQLPQTREEAENPAVRRVHAFPTSEQGVWRYNIASPSVPLAAIYPTDGATQLDYPYIPVRTAASEDRQDAVRDFLTAVKSSEGRKALQGQAFRTVDDVAGAAISPVNGLRWQKPPGKVLKAGTAQVKQALQVWTLVNLNVRLLSVIDISGSMLTKDPGAADTRINLTRAGAAKGLGLLSTESEVGTWVFSTKIGPGGVDYLQLMDVGRLNELVGGNTRRDVLLAQLNVLKARKGGSTGLYDTTLAAYKKMVSSYNPDALNSVVLFTDGRNEDPGSISLQQLLAELKKLYDPKKPVKIYTVGFGKEIDVAALRAISAATGAPSTATSDPAAIQQVLLQALAQRLCGGKPCKPGASP